MSHLGCCFCGKLFTIQAANSLDALAHTAAQQALSKRAENFCHEEVAQGFRACFPCTVARCLAVKLCGDLVPLVLCWQAAKNLFRLAKHLLQKLLLCCPVCHGARGGHACCASGNRPGRGGQGRSAEACTHCSHGIAHGIHGIGYALKGLAIILFTVVCTLLLACLARADGISIGNIHIAAMVGIPERISDLARQHGCTFSNCLGRTANFAHKSRFFFLLLRLLAAELAEVCTVEIKQVIACIGLRRPWGLLFGHVDISFEIRLPVEMLPPFLTFCLPKR